MQLKYFTKSELQRANLEAIKSGEMAAQPEHIERLPDTYRYPVLQVHPSERGDWIRCQVGTIVKTTPSFIDVPQNVYDNLAIVNVPDDKEANDIEHKGDFISFLADAEPGFEELELAFSIVEPPRLLCELAADAQREVETQAKYPGWTPELGRHACDYPMPPDMTKLTDDEVRQWGRHIIDQIADTAIEETHLDTDIEWLVMAKHWTSVVIKAIGSRMDENDPELRAYADAVYAKSNATIAVIDAELRFRRALEQAIGERGYHTAQRETEGGCRPNVSW